MEPNEVQNAIPAENAAPVYDTAITANTAPVNDKDFDEDSLPKQYRPLGPWAYWGLSVLYAVPVIGFIFLIVHSFMRSNINRRNFARSYWCGLLVAIFAFLVLAIVIIIGAVNLSTILPFLENIVGKLL